MTVISSTMPNLSHQRKIICKSENAPWTPQLFLIVNSSLSDSSATKKRSFSSRIRRRSSFGIFMDSCSFFSSQFSQLVLRGSHMPQHPRHHDNQRQKGLSCFLSLHLDNRLTASNLKKEIKVLTAHGSTIMYVLLRDSVFNQLLLCLQGGSVCETRRMKRRWITDNNVPGWQSSWCTGSSTAANGNRKSKHEHQLVAGI